MKKNNLFLENIFFYSLFLIAIYVVYIKTSLSLAFFLAILIISWFSKKDYFWLAFFFILTQGPAWFFADFESSHLPNFKFLPGITITTVDLFTLLMILKCIISKHSFGVDKINNELKIPFLLLCIYCLFSFMNGIFFWNGTLDIAIRFLRAVFYFSWLIFFTVLVEKKEDIYKFLQLIAPISFFILFAVVYFLFNKKDLINFFDPNIRPQLSINTVTGEIRPFMGGGTLLVLSYIITFGYLQAKLKLKQKLYLYMLSATTFLAVLFQATRFLFGIILFISVGAFINKIKKLPKIIFFVAALMLLITVFIQNEFIPADYLKESAWGRVSQILTLDQKKFSKIDTMDTRIDQMKEMLSKIYESPIFGYGFSVISYENYNNNLGFLNTILLFGVVGLVLYLFFFYSYFKMMQRGLFLARKEPSIHELVRILLVGFFALLLGFSISWDTFSIYYPHIVVFDMVFFGLSGKIIQFTQSEDENSL